MRQRTAFAAEGFDRRRKTVWLLAAVACAALLSGCSGDDNGVNTPGDSGAAVWPLTSGNSWTYQETDVPDPETFTVIGTAQVAGVTVAKVDYPINGLPPGYYVYLRNEGGNLYSYGNTYETYDTPDVLCKSSCSVGDSWFRSGVTWSVIATHESLTVPAGTFDCIHMREVEEGSEDVPADIWYKVGVGMIKRTSGSWSLVLVDEQIQ